MVTRIDQRLQLACLQPEIGKQVIEVNDPTIRVVVVPPYRVSYRIQPEAIVVLAIVHERRHLPNAL